MNAPNAGMPVRIPLLLPLAGGIAVLACSTAMSGLIAGGTWFIQLTLTVAVVVAAGVLVRGLRRGRRSPVLGALTVLVQLFVLLCLVVLLYTHDGIAGLLPGPTAFGDLVNLLHQSMEEIRVGTQPVPGTPALLSLVMLAIGGVAVLVDLLAVEARTPAVAGLALLCLYAVPASLSDELLPWWTFALGAGAFALLLAADRALRHQQWRGSVGLTAASGLRPTPPMVAVTATAVVVALVAGSSVTAVGTTGTLPGVGTTLATSDQAWGLNPFTKLNGELNQPDQPVELFRVRGLPNDAVYLRAVTLSTFDPHRGWRVGVVGGGQRLAGPLQPPPGNERPAPTVRVQVEPVHWRDNWLPLFGVPSAVVGPDPRVWRWEPDLSTAFAKAPNTPDVYAEQAVLRQPTTEQLRAAPAGTDGLNDSTDYTEPPQVDPAVARLAHQITDDQPTAFDKARAIWLYLTSGQYSYSLEAPSTSAADPTADFLFRGKQGFCEQFSSAMAVMLRLLGVPARVAVGFTDGNPERGYRSITTQDAHAWTEVYFRGQGWVPFDPTPLSGGRGVTPSYLATAQDAGPANRTAGPTPTAPVPPVQKAPRPQDKERNAPSAAAPDTDTAQRWWPPLSAALTWSAPNGALLAVGVLGGLAALGTVALSLLLRRSRRGRR